MRLQGSEIRSFVAQAVASGCVLEGRNQQGHLRLRHTASNKIFVAPSRLVGRRHHASNMRTEFRRFLAANSNNGNGPHSDE